MKIEALVYDKDMLESLKTVMAKMDEVVTLLNNDNTSDAVNEIKQSVSTMNASITSINSDIAALKQDVSNIKVTLYTPIAKPQE